MGGSPTPGRGGAPFLGRPAVVGRACGVVVVAQPATMSDARASAIAADAVLPRSRGWVIVVLPSRLLVAEGFGGAGPGGAAGGQGGAGEGDGVASGQDQRELCQGEGELVGEALVDGTDDPPG